MNERIKELAEQAGFEITPWRDELLPCVHQEGPIDIELEKFAELIVRECSAFVYNYPEKYLTRNQAREICLGMEKDFGVEL
jgi:hypothetical protein